jgi:DNA-binding winged helix-turn-helix (wHTH) protein/Tol biopolymer transport system component
MNRWPMSFLGPTSPNLRFGPFELDAAAGELRKAGTLIKLQPQPFRLLQLLAERTGSVVTREEIQQCLWSESTFVDFEHGINFSIKQIRGALADDAEKPRYVETLPRRGYRFIAQVEVSATGKNGKNGETGRNGRTGKNGTLAASVMVEIPRVRDVAAEFPSAHGKGAEVREQLGPAPQTAPDSSRAAIEAGPRERGKELAVAAAVLLAISSAVFWYAIRRAPPRNLPTEWKLRQLTTNPSENPVSNGAISPDGKYVAYADTVGMHLKLIETGDARLIPEPEGLNGKTVEWRIVPVWFPDSTRFLADAHPGGQSPAHWSSQGSSVWVVSALGGAPRKLRDDAIAQSVSPDGSLISFGTNKGRHGDREIWLMGPNGEDPHKLYETDENGSICCLHWFPNGRRVWYGTMEKVPGGIVTRELAGGPTTAVFPPGWPKTSWEYILLPDNRLLYPMGEPGAVGESCNYWMTPLDAQNGSPIGQPKQLTNWSGFCPYYASATADGRKLAFLKRFSHSTIQTAEVSEGGKRMGNLRGIALNEGLNNPLDWTADGKEVIFSSNRNGHMEIFKQQLEGDTAQPLVAGQYDWVEARVSPDGEWLVYMAETDEGTKSPNKLMRVPVAGGASLYVLTGQPYSEFRCARSPSPLCVITERTEDRKQMVMTAFNPLNGRGTELFRIDLDSEPRKFGWDLSPDGTRIAYRRTPEEPIEIVSLDGFKKQTIQVRGCDNLASLDWDADGAGFYVAEGVHGGTLILHVDLQGKAIVLEKNTGVAAAYVRPSPDRRHVAIQKYAINGNIWTLENF